MPHTVSSCSLGKSSPPRRGSFWLGLREDGCPACWCVDITLDCSQADSTCVRTHSVELYPLTLGPGEKTPRHGKRSRGTRAAPHCMTTPICPSDFHSSPGIWRRVLVKTDLEGTGQELSYNQFQEECLHPEAAVLLKAPASWVPAPASASSPPGQ